MATAPSRRSILAAGVVALTQACKPAAPPPAAAPKAPPKPPAPAGPNEKHVDEMMRHRADRMDEVRAAIGTLEKEIEQAEIDFLKRREVAETQADVDALTKAFHAIEQQREKLNESRRLLTDIEHLNVVATPPMPMPPEKGAFGAVSEAGKPIPVVKVVSKTSVVVRPAANVTLLAKGVLTAGLADDVAHHFPQPFECVGTEAVGDKRQMVIQAVAVGPLKVAMRKRIDASRPGADRRE